MRAHERPEWWRVNRAGWDERAPAHAASPDYEVERLTGDPRALSGVVSFDLPRLGDLAGVRGVHLQCHIGTDTISLARLGARMTGLDFSPASVAVARGIADRAGLRVDFVEADVDAAPEVLGEGAFDLVYTGIGALGWLPSIDRWAGVVHRLLRPGGRLFVREGHPVLWSLDDDADPPVIRHSYFETLEPAIWPNAGTYVATDAVFAIDRSYEWNHGLGEILGALLARGMRITRFEEHETIPWKAFDRMVPAGVRGEFRMPDGTPAFPLSYTLEAVREA